MTYFLMTIVLLVWGLLFYKIFFSVSRGKIVTNSTVPASGGSTENKLDTYVIHSYSRDPFLSILTDTETVDEITIEPVKKIPKVLPKVLPEYFGIIFNGTKNCGIFRSDKQYYFVSPGDTFTKFRLKKIWIDSVVLAYDGNDITLHLRKSGK